MTKLILTLLTSVVLITGTATLHALGGDDTNTTSQVNDATDTCQSIIHSAGQTYSKARADAIIDCFNAVVDCDRQANATAALNCRRATIRTDTGLCAEGVLDGGISTVGDGSATAVDTLGSTAVIDQALITLITAIKTNCYDPAGVEISDSSTGLSFSDNPADEYELVDVINKAPGGIGCMANAKVLESAPLSDEITQTLLLPLHETCVVIDGVGASLGDACSAGTDCGSGGNGICGKLAEVLYNGGDGTLQDCRRSCISGEITDPSNFSCVQCPPGRFSSNGDSSTCQTCSAGTFTEFTGSVNCSSCPTGFVSDNEASTCTVCQPGRVPNDAKSICESCPRGKYAPINGLPECLDCPAGTMSSNEGADGCTTCIAGTFSAATSSTCENCSPGSFSSAGASECTDCPAGYSAGTAASECSACNPGTFAASAGSSECSACQPGTYNPLSGSQSCLSCRAGTISESQASTCTLCAPGSFAAEAGDSECTQCPKGFFMAKEGATKCKKCPRNKFSRRVGATKCKRCKEGFEPNRKRTRCVRQG